MPRMRTEPFGTGDQSWLVNTEGLEDAVTGTLDVSAFSSVDDYPNGYIKSGYPLGRITATKLYAPFDTSASDGTQVHVGHLAEDQPVVGTADFGASIVTHGNVKPGKLPVAFDPTDDGVSPRFTYLSEA